MKSTAKSSSRRWVSDSNWFPHSAGYYVIPNKNFYIDQVQKLPCHMSEILIINLVCILKMWHIGGKGKNSFYLYL